MEATTITGEVVTGKVTSEEISTEKVTTDEFTTGAFQTIEESTLELTTDTIIETMSDTSPHSTLITSESSVDETKLTTSDDIMNSTINLITEATSQFTSETSLVSETSSVITSKETTETLLDFSTAASTEELTVVTTELPASIETSTVLTKISTQLTTDIPGSTNPFIGTTTDQTTSDDLIVNPTIPMDLSTDSVTFDITNSTTPLANTTSSESSTIESTLPTGSISHSITDVSSTSSTSIEIPSSPQTSTLTQDVTTDSTSAVITTEAVTQTITTTGLPVNFFTGANDIYYPFADHDQPFVISRSISPSYFFGDLHEKFQIYSNGYLLFDDNDFIFRTAPITSSSDWTFAYVSPFWTETSFSQNGKLGFGEYTDPTSESTLFNSVETVIKASSSSRQGFTASTIYIISWINLTPILAANQPISYQAIFAIDQNTAETFLIYNYQPITYDSYPSSQTALIGYQIVFSDGTSPFLYVDPLSNAFSSKRALSAPFTILNGVRSTFDVSFQGTDACLIWFNSQNTQAIKSFVAASLSNNNYVACPCTNTQASLNKKFTLYSTGSTGICYSLVGIGINADNAKQLCCYDETYGDLINSNENSGFLYEGTSSLVTVFQTKALCCNSNTTWESCRRFYEVYQPSTCLGYKEEKLGWSGGDPNILTYDELTYIFNGNGEYILSKADDDSFMVQSHTKIISNIETPSIRGTVYTGFAVKTTNSPIIQLELDETDPTSPDLCLYVDRIKQPYKHFTTNTSFLVQYPQSDPKAIISGTSRGVSVLMDNGLSMNVIVSSLSNNNSLISWLALGMNLDNNVRNYTNRVSGLMGNFNGNPNDDIRSRDGIVSTATNESVYYATAETWKISSTEENLFVYDAAKNVSYSQDFTPTFLDVLIAQNLNNSATDYSAQLNSLLVSCSNSYPCASDSLLTGILDFGLNTKTAQDQVILENSIQSYIPPSIIFTNSTIKIDWSIAYQRNTAPALTLSAIVVNQNTGSTLNLAAVVNIVNKNITRSQTFSSFLNAASQTITFSYLPIPNEIPVFSIIATDSSTNQSTVRNLNKVQICNCQTVDTNATCLNTVQLAFSSSVDFLACSCSSSYTGAFCTTLKDFCIAKPCASGQTCNTLSPLLQTTGNEFVCCNSGLVFNSITGTCDATTTTSTSTTTTTEATTTISLNAIDATALALSIALPIIAFLILLIIILFIIYMISKRRESNKKSKNKTMFPPSGVQTVSENVVPKTGLTRMGNFSSIQDLRGGSTFSAISGSSFSVPTDYHIPTTPYPPWFDSDEDESNVDIDFDNFGELVMGEDGPTDSLNDFNNQDIVQAFNPYVKIPRPKYENSPSKMFKH